MARKKLRGQSAIEFLMTYGWAILIMVIVIAVIFMLGIFSPKSAIPESCVLPAGFSCYSFKVDATGKLKLDLGQAKGNTLIITGIACSKVVNATPIDLTAPITLESGQHAIVVNDLQCRDENGDPATSGDIYRGKITIAYHEAGSTMERITRGDITGRLSGGTGPAPT